VDYTNKLPRSYPKHNNNFSLASNTWIWILQSLWSFLINIFKLFHYEVTCCLTSESTWIRFELKLYHFLIKTRLISFKLKIRIQINIISLIFNIILFFDYYRIVLCSCRLTKYAFVRLRHSHVLYPCASHVLYAWKHKDKGRPQGRLHSDAQVLGLGNTKTILHVTVCVKRSKWIAYLAKFVAFLYIEWN